MQVFLSTPFTEVYLGSIPSVVCTNAVKETLICLCLCLLTLGTELSTAKYCSKVKALDITWCMQLLEYLHMCSSNSFMEETSHYDLYRET